MTEEIVIAGAGGGDDSHVPVEDQDTLRSRAVLSILDLLGEGKIGGLVNGRQSIFINDVPLQNSDGTLNFDGAGVSGPVLGEQDQQVLDGYSDVETPFAHGVQVKKTTPFTFNVSDSTVDQVRVVMTLPALTQVDGSNGDVHGSSVQYSFAISTKVGGTFGSYVPIYAGEAWSATGTQTLTSSTELQAQRLAGSLSVGMSYVVKVTIPAAGDVGNTVVRHDYWDGSAWVQFGTQTITSRRTVFGYEAMSVSSVVTSSAYWVETPGNYDKVRAVIVSSNYTAVFEGKGVKSRSISDKVTITGKSRSKYQRSHILNLPKPGAEWNIRVTRVTDDSSSTLLSNDTYVDSHAEIRNLKLFYPNSALIGLRLDSAYFTSVPARSYLVSGLYVKVPTNYSINDATNVRTYSGIWDGTFNKLLVSDSPAWILYDLLTNERYGLGNYIDASQIDKAKLYEIAKYCDTQVPDGKGGTEPRFTINVAIQNRVEAYQLIIELCAVFRGMSFWTGGAVSFMNDSPRDADMLYSHANIIGDFEYAGSSRKDRHSVAVVTWNDPDEKFKRKSEYVEDAELVDKIGIRQLKFDAFGCTSRGQATRAGRWALYTERYETDVISFKVGLDSALVLPGEVIKIADRFRAGKKMSGRLLASTATSATVDAPITLAAAGATLTIRAPDGTLVDRTLTNTAGVASVLTWATPLTSVPVANAVFLVSEAALQPQLARVVSVSQTKGKIGEFTISALRHYEGKYALIENDLKLETPIVSLIDTKTVPKPLNLAAYEAAYKSAPGVLGNRLTFTWEGTASRFEVKWRTTSPAISNWTVQTLSSKSIDIDGVEAGTTYEFQVTASNALLGGVSAPATLVYTTVGGVAAPIAVSGVTYVVKDGGIEFTWPAPSIENWSLTRIRLGTSWAAGTEVFSGKATKFLWPFQASGSYTFFARHEALGGLVSATDYTFTINVLAPASPTINSVDSSEGTALIKWTDAKTTQPIRHYIIKAGTSSSTFATATEVKKSAGTNTADSVVFTSGGAKRVFVQAVDVAGNASAATQFDFTVVIGTATDMTPPPALSGFAATAGFSGITLAWTPTTYTEGGGPDSTNVYGVDWPTGDAQPAFSAAKLLDRTPAGVGVFVDVVGTSKRRIYWLKNCSRAGVEQTTPTGPQNATTTTIAGADLGSLVVDATKLADGSVTATKIAAGAVALTKFASGIEPVTVVSSVPSSLVTRTIFNTTDGKLYRWNGASYAATVLTTDLSGQVTNGQIADSAISAVKIANSAVTAAKTAIAAIDPSSGNLVANSVTATQIAAGAVVAGKVAADAIGANEIAAGSITATKLNVTVGGGNLVVNSSMEAASSAANRPLGYYQYNNAGISTSYEAAAGRAAGTKAFALRALATGATTFGVLSNNTVDGPDTGGVAGGWEAGKTYVVSVYAKKSAGSAMSAIGLRWNVGPATTVDVATPGLSTGFQRYIWRITWGASVEGSGGFFITAVGTVATNDIIYFDDIQVEEGDYPTMYTPRSVELLPGTIVANMLAANSVTATAIAAGAINASHIAADSITGGQIAAGAISASEIAANAVTTNKLLVTGVGRAINDDPTFQDSTAWVLSGGSGSYAFVTDTTSPVGTRILRATNDVQFSATKTYPISGGTTYKVSMWARKTSGSGVMYLRLYCSDSSGVLRNYAVTALSPATGTFEGVNVPSSWTKYTGYITADAAAVIANVIIHLNWSTTGVTDVTDCRFEEYVGADLIVDGAIIASKLAANSIAVGTAAIQNGAITNAMIANATIDTAKIANLDAAKITSGTLDANRIAAGSIDAKIANLDAAVIGSGTLNVARIADASITSAKITSLDAAKIQAGTITTDKLVVGSVTANVSQTTSASIPVDNSAGGSTYTGVLSVNITTTGGYVRVSFSGDIYARCPTYVSAWGVSGMSVAIYKNGTFVRSVSGVTAVTNFYQSEVAGQARRRAQLPFSVDWIDTSPGSVVNTYEVRMRCDTRSGAEDTGTVTVPGLVITGSGYLSAQEFKV